MELVKNLRNDTGWAKWAIPYTRNWVYIKRVKCKRSCFKAKLRNLRHPYWRTVQKLRQLTEVMLVAAATQSVFVRLESSWAKDRWSKAMWANDKITRCRSSVKVWQSSAGLALSPGYLGIAGRLGVEGGGGKKSPPPPIPSDCVRKRTKPLKPLSTVSISFSNRSMQR